MQDSQQAMEATYKLPSGNVQIAFSGGRTSGYMLHKILEANGNLPDRVQVTFQNTGREMPQTLDFVAETARHWGVIITWLQYTAQKPFFEIVEYQDADREGGPFEALINKRKFLPNQKIRFCTIELKIRTAKRYLVSQGWKHWTSAIGFRYDEKTRVMKPQPKDRWTTWTPLYDAKISRHDIADFWSKQPYDLRLPNIRGNCWLGNCDGCFLKSEANIGAFTRDYPARAAWWEDMESLVDGLTKTRDVARFSKRYSRASMRDFMERQCDMSQLSVENILCQANEGECFG